MKDIYCSYYTNSEDITSYMVAKMGVSPNDIILEPSVGEGIFVEELLKQNTTIRIDALDLNQKAIEILKDKFSQYENIEILSDSELPEDILKTHSNTILNIRETDTLFDEQLDFYNFYGGYYDKVIGNPPYGAWQDYEKRALLKKKYPGQYVKETYSLFLYRCISLLKDKGRLSFIIPDTFMFLNLHDKIRKIILSSTKIDEILIFPSKFFPGVSFGYSNLSIITLEKCERNEAFNNTVKVIKGFKSSSEFENILRGDYPEHLKIYELNQYEIYSSQKNRFILADDNNTTLIGNAQNKLGDVADIVTGFYSGNNKKFICAKDESVKGAKNYQIVDVDKIFDCTSLNGIDNTEEGYIPYIKGSSETRYRRKEDEWFVRWDKGTVEFYNSDKKARFQNSQFYFKTGIAIPMVKSSVIRATLMKQHVFDQSIVGIFPKKEEDMYYILALMNSDIINKLIHIINPTANNSSNYIKQLPYIEPSSDTKNYIIKNVKKIMTLEPDKNMAKIEELHNKINSCIDDIYSSELVLGE